MSFLKRSPPARRIIASMRRWLLVLMLLLLPIRGLVGEVMAAQMLQQHAAAAAPVAMPAATLAGHDCDEHAHAAAVAPDDSTAVEKQPTGDCPTCPTCQACSSVALSAAVSAVAAERAAQPPPSALQRDYPSAEPALAFKPPRG